jgi:crotonobetainyl-CoA:carnitine CoA-transferase CaiB-like acyl-CoA transferase
MACTGPLAGITVVTLEQAVSAPMCTRVLADFGARIIKVENPHGGDFARHYDDVVNGPDGLAAHFVWANRGKESVTLDVKAPAGMQLLHRLLDGADALVSNLAPGATARLGIAPADLGETHPQVIPVEIDGYGSGGPISHKRAYDLLIQAESGSCAVTGYPGMPAKPGPPVADICTGLYAALSIVSLLVARNSGGDNPAPAVSVSLFDTMTDIMGYQLTYTQHCGVDQQPLGMGSPAVAPYGAFDTGDEQTVVLGTTNDREWQRLARDIIARPDLADDARFATNAGRVTHREILNDAIGSWCARHDLAQIQKTADAAGIGNSRYNLPSEVVAHPQLLARDRWRQVDTSNGEIPALLPPPVITGFDPPMGPVPGLGEHTDTVLGELGLDTEEIGRLREQGAIGPVLLSSDADGVRTLTLNRPQRKNALNPQLWIALRDALRTVADDDSVRALVLTGAGGAFCSGVDISVADDVHPNRKLRRLTDVALALHELAIPTIAKITGAAVGAGWNLALGCDLVVATPESTFAQIFAKRGLSVDLGGSWLLPKLVGLQQANRLVLLAETIDAEKARSLGLVTWVKPAEQIDAFVDDLGRRLATGPSVAIAHSKALLKAGAHCTLPEALANEARAQPGNFATADSGEAYAAFAEKRDPSFTGRWAVSRSEQNNA